MRKAFYLLILLLPVAEITTAQGIALVPKIYRPVYFDVSPALRDVARMIPGKPDVSWKDGVVKNYISSYKDVPQIMPGYRDPGLQSTNGYLPSDTTIRNFEGTPNVSSSVPPDTHGEVGPNHFFQVVNCSYSIFNKSGDKILGPLPSSSVWTGMPNNSNSGDAIVLYDEQANRWLFSQFSLPNGSSTPPFYQMIAVSQTPDPTGSWYRWEYEFTAMPDYPKFGVWPDGYYMSSNLFGGGWAGNGVDCFNRTAMIAGDPGAQRISFTVSPGADGFTSFLPSDCDGTFPAMGTPDYFTFIGMGGIQHLGVCEFHADWANPLNSTFGNKIYLNVNSFTLSGDAGNGIPQLGSDKYLETLADRLMYRQQYRVFNGYSSMVLNHTVDGTNGRAGIRWYELRNTGTGWTLYQQATYSPADNNSRWMGSIAQDTAGTIALGYSVSGPGMYPALRYTGRLKNDPLNQMTMTEKGIINGGGSQQGSWGGRSRWGDYSAISVDPFDPTTFWFTSEYYATSSMSGWQTRIGSFTFQNVFSSAASANPALMCSSSPDSSQLNAYAYGGSGTYTYSWTSIPAGFTSQEQHPKVFPAQSTKYIVAVSDGTNTRHDTASVTIFSAPTVSTGGDTVVCWYVPEIALHGTAQNYSKTVWGSGGDGHFSDRYALATSYSPGSKDKAKGWVQLILMALPLSPCTADVTSVRKIIFDPCTGIAGKANREPGIAVSPNPAQNNATLTLSNLNGNADLTITGMDGKIVYSSAIVFSGDAEQSVRLDVSGFSKGLYLVKLQNETRVFTARFIVE